LREWVGWLLAAEGTSPDALLAQATDIAPMLAALTEVTDGAAETAGALLLEGVARIAPQQAVRLAPCQLRQCALPFPHPHASLLSGFANALLDPSNDEPTRSAQVDDTAALLSAVMAGILAPACRVAPGRALDPAAELLGKVTPKRAAAIREQLARAVDIHVLP